MTPGARVAASIEVLDRWLAGQPVEQVLTNWARSNRYAGSTDRAAVRDLVFDAVRCKRSFAALGGSETGRGLMLGAARATGQDLAALFTGQGHAPPSVDPAETGLPPAGEAALDCPDWLALPLRAALGDDFTAVLQALQRRAPVFLRVNTAKISRDQAILRLEGEGITAVPHPLADTALELTEGARKISGTSAYQAGLVELQDAASQAVIQALPLKDGLRVLDYCAGGGGKTLAMAARARLALFAHDANPNRLRDLPDRAKRAGARVSLMDTTALETAAAFDLILTDVPCSGSGAWRRAPEGKWGLTAQRLEELTRIQAEILDKAARLVRPKGILAYATCSLLDAENTAQISAFLARNNAFRLDAARRLTPLDGGDGFYFAILARK